MMLPGARYWNTRLDVVKNCLEARLGQYSRQTYMSVVASHVTCTASSPYSRQRLHLLFGNDLQLRHDYVSFYMCPEMRAVLRAWNLFLSRVAHMQEHVHAGTRASPCFWDWWVLLKLLLCIGNGNTRFNGNGKEHGVVRGGGEGGTGIKIAIREWD